MRAPTKLTVLRIMEVETGATSKSCPHCSATGKTIYWFIASDGQVHGAMMGCLKNAFYHSQYSTEISKLEKLLKKYPGWKKIECQLEMIYVRIERDYGVNVREKREIPRR